MTAIITNGDVHVMDTIERCYSSIITIQMAL